MNRRQKLVQQQFLNNEQAVIRRLQQVYGVALKDINGNIERLMKRFDPLTGDLPQSAVYQLQYQKMLKGQVEGILKQMQTGQYLTVSDYLDGCYTDGFVGSLFDLHGQGVPLAIPLDQEAMVRAVQLDSKISQGLYTRLGEDVDLLKKKITAQVSRSIAAGVSFEQTAKQLAGYTRIGYNNAIRIARTEGHRIQCSAADDAAHLAKDRGADVLKQWDATLDGLTRESHVAVDGEFRELNEPFSNGLMFPGDPAGGAAEVINCRCAYLQRARWAMGNKFTKWNNFTDQLETFDSPEAYDEFKKGFFSPENKRYMNYVQQMQDKYGTKDFRKVLDRMTDREYNHYSKLLANNPMYNKKAPAPKLSADELKKRIADNEYEVTQIKGDLMFVERDIGRHSTHIYDDGANVDKDQIEAELKKAEDRLRELDEISDRYYNRPGERGTDEYYAWREWRKSIDMNDIFNEQVRLNSEVGDLKSLLGKREKYEQWIQWKKDNPLSALQTKKTDMLKQIDQLNDEIADFKKQLIQAESTTPVALDMFPEYFRKSKASKAATQTFVDALNDATDLDPNIRKLYTHMGDLPYVPADCTIKYTADGHALQRWKTYSGQTTKCQLKVPKMQGDDLIGQKSVAMHEIGHFIDMGVGDGRTLRSRTYAPLTGAIKSSGRTMSGEVKDLFDDFAKQYRVTADAVSAKYRAQRSALSDDVRAGRIGWKDYDKAWKAANKAQKQETDYLVRNLCGGGVDMLSDIYDALSYGDYQDNRTLLFGHGGKYYRHAGTAESEIFANYMSLSVNRPDLVAMLRRDKPDLCDALDGMIEEMAGGI